MRWLEDQFLGVRDFMEAGGPLLWWIAVTIFAMWLLIIERSIFYKIGLPKMMDAARQKWEARSERRSWNAHMIREAMISEVEQASEQWLAFIKTLVALCPLLGLMGTVTGMIRVFEVMALSGSGNVRSMAAGVDSDHGRHGWGFVRRTVNHNPDASFRARDRVSRRLADDGSLEIR